MKMSALVYAASNNQVDVVRHFINPGVDVNEGT